MVQSEHTMLTLLYTCCLCLARTHHVKPTLYMVQSEHTMLTLLYTCCLCLARTHHVNPTLYMVFMSGPDTLC